MKTKLLFLGFIMTFFFNGSVNGQIVPDGDCTDASTTFWTVDSNIILSPIADASITSFSGLVLNSPNSGNFTLKSSNFSLLSGENYQFDIGMAYFARDNNAMSSAIIPLLGMGQYSVMLKDSQNNIVESKTMSTTSSIYAPEGFPIEYFKSSSFNVASTGSYYIEISGPISYTQGSTDYLNTPGKETFIFDKIEIVKNLDHQVNGKVTFDAGNNNCASSSIPLANVQLKTTGVNGTYFSSSNSAGDFVIEFNENGTTTTEIISQGLSTSPTNHSNTFTSGTASTINNQDFCVTSSTTGDNVSVLIIPTSEARPGFKSRYRIQYTNRGSTTVSGDVVLNFEDTKMHTPTSNPTATSSSSNSLTFTYSSLTPFEIRTIDVEFTNNTPTQNPNPLNGGDFLNFTASITPLTSDVNQTDNSFALNHLVVNSYDPNDATILEGPQITAVQATQDLHFRLRFQNTGTASAININIKTMLDADLDWATFTPIASSHSYNTSLNSTTGEVNFSFPNIQLADSTSNEPASHGWVLFKAKPKSSFAIGDTIDCDADIFFDYNPPITTNVATTQIHVPTNNYTLIPDPAFERELIRLGYDTVVDGSVITANISGIISLGLLSTPTKISDLTGIEDFTAIETLTAGDNNLTRVDFSKNLNLKILQLPKNNISYINISKNINLEFLNLRNNNLTKLDVSMLPNLGGLSIYNNPDLEVLNVKNGNAAPWQLFLAYNTPKLTCIEVDDISFFNSNFPSHSSTNSHTSYNTDCNYPTTNVPDSVFENYLETHDRDGNIVSVGDVTSMGNGIANDQKVFTYRICNVIQLDVSGKSIGALTGIEDFRDLEVFGFLGGSTTITNMDLSNNTKLKRIHSGLLSNLSTITLGNLPDLTFLQFGYDNVSSIDISGLPSLDYFNAPQTKLTSLSTINNPNLRVLSITSPIKHLNVSSNTMLENLGVGPDLETLNIANGNNNNLTLSIQNNPNLTCITADATTPATGLTGWAIDSQHMFNATLCANSLTYVPDDNFENYLETHDANGNVVALGASNSLGNGIANDNHVFTNRINTVTKLDVNTKSILDLAGIEDFTALEELIAWANNLSSLNVTQNTALKKLNFFANSITSIDLSNNTQLTHLDCSQNSLNSLSVTDLTSLESLTCGGNSFSTIDISQNTSLISLSCTGLSDLDFTNNLMLKQLAIANINISSIDLSILTDLELISVTGMPDLKGVDVSQNLKINSIGIESNPEIISLNINNTQNTIITYFNSYNNSKLTCIQVDDVTYANSNWGSDKDNHTSFNTDCSSVWTVNVSAATLAALLAITPSIDTNGDGNITLAEAAAYTNPIDLSGQNLTSVEGLQAFTNVTQIDLQNNNITDFSPLTDASIPYINKSNGKTKIVSRTGAFNLEELNITNNVGVQSLDVSKLTKLKKLIVKDNPDLITVSVQNGSNASIIEFDSSNTPKLTCILVDDINANYLSNWTKDAANTFVADEADCRSRVLSVTQENLQEYISVYPNPIKDFVTVKLSNQLELKNIKIINLIGEKIITTEQEKINFGKLPSGIYLLRITTDKGIITKKIIKE